VVVRFSGVGCILGVYPTRLSTLCLYLAGELCERDRDYELRCRRTKANPEYTRMAVRQDKIHESERRRGYLAPCSYRSGGRNLEQ